MSAVPAVNTDHPFLPWLAHGAAALRGLALRRRILVALSAGMISALAFPPYNLTPLLFVCFPVLLWLVQGAKTARQAALTGWSFGFGFMVLGFYWIAASMFVDIAYFWWAVPFAVAGLPFFFALNYAVTTAIAWKFGTRGVAGVLVFALSWLAGEYSRGHLFGGFPWNLTGYAWTPVLPILQITSVIGIYGLSLLTLTVACLTGLLADGRKYLGVVAAGFVCLALCAGWGEVRLSKAAKTYPALTAPDIRIRLVQPNVGQLHKWDAATREADFQRLLTLSSAPRSEPVTHVIWPETASTFRLAEDAVHRGAIADHIPAAGSVLTGVIRTARDANNKVHYYNSLVAVDGQARLVAAYDKVHLVPFGEYFPFQNILHIRAIANLGMNFDHGDAARSLRVLGLPPFSPLICYEAVFSGDVVDAEDRPHFLLNITNDGWYGQTAGPYQHFANVRVRAIEEGLPLLRAANTGISGVIDAYGHVTARLGIGKTGFIDSDLPGALAPTVFARWHETPLWTLWGALAMLALVLRSRWFRN